MELSNKELRRKYEDKLLAVKNAIDEWDPLGLLPWAPSDEYDSESQDVLVRLHDAISIQEIAEIIADVFTRSFGETFAIENCIEPAKGIYSNLGLKE